MNEEYFFSINRLVEFGLSLAIAQQMVKSMNDTFTRMSVPGVMNSMEPVQRQFYFAIIDGKQTGPFSEQEISRLISEKKVVKETYLWRPGLNTWEIAEKLPDILRLVALAQPPCQENS